MNTKKHFEIKDDQLYNEIGECVHFRGVTCGNFENSLTNTFTGMNIETSKDYFDEVKLRGSNILRVCVWWNLVENFEDAWNEKYLFLLHEFIKEARDADMLLYLVPCLNVSEHDFWLLKDSHSDSYFIDKFSLFMKHVLSVVSQCDNIVGISLPNEIMDFLQPELQKEKRTEYMNSFIEVIHEKYPQYYFMYNESANEELNLWSKKERTEKGILSVLFLENGNFMLSV